MSTPKVSLYSLSDLKNTCDDHLPIYLSTATTPSNAPLPRELRFTPSHFKNYVRLGLGYSSVAIALYIFYLDYYLKREFIETKSVTFFAVIGYFTLNTFLTAWMWFGERGMVFAGSRPEASSSTAKRTSSGSEKTRTNIEIFSHAPSRKFSPVYRLTATWTVSGPGGTSPDPAKSGSVDVSTPFTRFFAEDGHFVPSEFEAWLRREIPMAGKGAIGRVEEISPQGADLIQSSTKHGADGNVTVGGMSTVVQSQRGDTIVLGGGSTSADAATPTPKKRGRPRKD